ncbi:Pimeloyl-ACP methyl ester carboxylesterase [Flavobacterium fluvii]|uniref:Pimeloyl-ACP methyl ester carboxylesterase n=1 Tax=Flavobacterium fluvii TaxID=468056 RepID=A0A1M5FKQ3_9FLAO|nr:alpha/beta hydrolase [Flavobacterium fluvii]SHF92110.1 Pimeloyl-ACP methyl ester carboxylesterase [Flavobacterium fluvii]
MKRTVSLLLIITLFCSFNLQSHEKSISRNRENKTAKIDSTFTIEIGGIRQFIQIKTDDSTKPVLLFLAGGPGGSMMNSAHKYTKKLKDKFTIVQWDQRDAGKTLELNKSPVQPSVAQMEKDTYEVIEFILKKLKKEKIYLAGCSFGNILGFHIVEKHPEVLHAYLAMNPVVSQLESERLLLARLKEVYKNNEKALAELSSVKMPHETANDLFYVRKWLFVMDGNHAATKDGFKNFFFKWSKTWFPVMQELMDIDLPKTLTEVKCPVYFFLGKEDIQTSTAVAEKYFNAIKAPKKGLYLFERSRHSIQETEPEKFQKIIIEDILAKNTDEKI